ncbi:hypothetical protein BpHYR1_008775 [Brachionus plicatilis]|uniref:Uncharacterized protein n=1 Tax=Brachionus plicatilis TaxID=10195 RepID=A0A3M7PC33_BRAPC|nr:hypothetical protein BpHYR1_008775 [Brachionus plicatilis]
MSFAISSPPGKLIPSASATGMLDQLCINNSIPLVLPISYSIVGSPTYNSRERPFFFPVIPIFLMPLL